MMRTHHEDPPRYERAHTVRLVNPVLATLAMMPVLAAAGAVLHSLVTGSGAALVAPHLLAFGAAGIVSVFRHRRLPWLQRRIVRIDREHLRAGDLDVPRASIRRALYLPATSRHPSMVYISSRRRLPVEVLVADRQEAEGLLAALGFDAAHSVARFRPIRSLSLRTRVLTIAAFVALGPVAALISAASGRSGGGLFVVVPLVLAFVVFAAVPVEVLIGADGIAMRHFGWRRFIPTRDVKSVRYFQESGMKGYVSGAELELALGERLRLTMPRNAEDEAAAMVERIEEALAAHRSGAAEQGAMALARGRMPLRVWLRSLRSIGSGANATHRTAPLPHEHLWSVLESSAAAPVDRAAAAVALAASQEPDAKERVRIAAQSIAEPRVRVAVEAASGDDDQALVAALDALTREDAEP